MAFTALMFLTVPLDAAAENFKGKPRVLDGDTILLRKTRIWLYGIDAPEYRQVCHIQGRPWSCGKAAKMVLMQAIGSKRVTCVSKPIDGATRGELRARVLAVCQAGRVVLNEWMVKMGWAMAFRPHGTDYTDEERTAKHKRRGVWAGTFIKPWEWRRRESK